MGRIPKHPTASKKVGVLIEEYVLESLAGEDISYLVNELLKQWIIQQGLMKAQDVDKYESEKKKKKWEKNALSIARLKGHGARPVLRQKAPPEFNIQRKNDYVVMSPQSENPEKIKEDIEEELAKD